METLHSFWQLGDELRGQSKVAEDRKWLMAASKLAEQTRSKGERVNNLDLSKGMAEIRPTDRFGFQEDNKFEGLNFNMLNLDSKMAENVSKSSLRNTVLNMNAVYQKCSINNIGNLTGCKHSGNIQTSKEANNNNITIESNNGNNAVDKRFKTLPASETLPRNEVLGGYIFVCNNDTMQEDLKRQLFGLPPRYRDSVRAITPGLPLFLYNYTTHQLHGIFEVRGCLIGIQDVENENSKDLGFALKKEPKSHFINYTSYGLDIMNNLSTFLLNLESVICAQAATFGGSNIDPTAWEDKKCKGESRFPAQVRIRVRKLCKPLEEDAFRPVLHHYDGPKFRLELSVPETLDLLDLCEQASSTA